MSGVLVSDAVFLPVALAVILMWGSAVTAVVMLVAASVGSVLAGVAGVALVYGTLLTLVKLEHRFR